ncbi:LamG-like jellyroll fold domain-containing protein [Psychroserpens sp. Hel_I_66]|uniref:LamG-like jellyroll fold domain-containing protein n=1 Tax=Psychroserpens sp. Hel_I_66 TaxID=1250004 RepID=UPI000645CC4A|nr:LamG-like jellyroll fold domain-containing protein [Psychroserpens sp. Hel_I_66]
MKFKLYFFLLAFISLNFAVAQNYDHVYSKVIGIYQQPSWVTGQEYEIENFSNFSKCHTNIDVNYTFNLEAGATGVIKMYAVNSTGENLINSINVTNNPVSGSFTIPAGLLPIDQFLIKWQIGNTTSSNFIYENFTFTVNSPEASMPTEPVVEDVYYSVGEVSTELSANGTDLKWYTSNTGGMPSTTAPIPNTNSIGITTYYVTQSDAGGCESRRKPINVYVAELATHLNFDGIDDYVALPNNVGSTLSGGTELTIEYWFKGSRVQSAVRFQNNPNDFIVAGWGGGNPQFIVSTDGGVNGLEIGTTSEVEDNTWHHVACVWKKNDVFATYLDGVLQNSRPAADVNLPVFSGSVGNLGNLPGFSEYTNGNLDDVRIWNVARTAEQISASKNCELQGNETGLVAYYNFNQGYAEVANPSISSLTNATTNVNDATLTNFALSGSSSNWLAGSPVTTGSIIPSEATVTTAVIYTQGDIAQALTASIGTNGTGLLWYTSATGDTGSTTAPTPDTATVGSTSYWVSSTNANGCESERTEIIVAVVLPATHLNFDGVNDYVPLSTTPTNIPSGNSNYTIEAMINPSQIGDRGIVGWGDYGITNKTNAFRLTTTGLVNYWWANDLFIPYTFITNTWYHVAATYDGTTRSIYVDGVLIGSDTPTASSHNLTNTSNVTIGRTLNSEYFSGSIDEVRIWNVPRTAEQIKGSKNCELQGSETGLVVYYKFNQGSDASGNTSVLTLADASANANNGTLTNFDNRNNFKLGCWFSSNNRYNNSF